MFMSDDRPKTSRGRHNVTKHATPGLPEKRGSVATVTVYVIFALTGIGIGLPGTLLPLLTARWHMNDAGAGVFLLALFIGSSAGSLLARGVLVLRLAGGCLLSAVALFLFPWLHDATPLLVGLYGLGLGTAMTSISLLQSRRRALRRTREMAALNLTWALGALAGPALLLEGSARYGSPKVLITFAGLLLVAALGTVALVPVLRFNTAPVSQTGSGAPRAVPLAFFFLISLATGIESTMGSWLSTYSVRAGHVLNVTVSTVTAFWAGFMCSRLIAAQTGVGHRKLHGLLTGLSLLLLTGLLLLLLHRNAQTDILAALLVGGGVGPQFPVFLSLQLEHGEAGNVGFLAAGVGAALLPLLTGTVSQWTHSLRSGLGVLLPAGVLMAWLGNRLTKSSHDRGSV